MPAAAQVGILFDFDGVIVDSEALQFESYVRVLERFGAHITREEYEREWIAQGTGPPYAVRRFDLPIDAVELRKLKDPVYHAILRERAALMPGVEAALEGLGAHFPLALATNSNAADTEFVVDRFGLRRFFSAILTRERYGEKKPAPDAFLAAAAALGLPPRACVVIEDAYKGVVAARRAGCACVAIPNDYTRGNDFSLADRILGSLAELTPELVTELVRCGQEAAEVGSRAVRRYGR